MFMLFFVSISCFYNIVENLILWTPFGIVVKAWSVWDKVSKNGLSKICRREPLKILKGYGVLKQTISLQIF